MKMSEETKLNELIFNSVQSCMNNEDDILVKICLGEATEEEKQDWQREKGISDEVTDVLKQYCDMGFNMASKLDTKIKIDKDVYLEKIDALSAEIQQLKIRIDSLERNADKHVEELIRTYPNHL
jgi:hypothetical protein